MVSDRVEFNMNDEVRVRLTSRGRHLLRENHADLFKTYRDPPPYLPPEEVDGWSTWQLWRLMQEFGAHLHNGCDVPFETVIELVSPPKDTPHG